MNNNKLKVGEFTVRVVTPDNISVDELTPEDKELDERASAAVKSAIKKAKICKKPIAKYDSRKKKAYLKMPNGEKKYAK